MSSKSALMVVHFMETARSATLYNVLKYALRGSSSAWRSRGDISRKHKIVLPGERR